MQGRHFPPPQGPPLQPEAGPGPQVLPSPVLLPLQGSSSTPVARFP
jgi:hypothetical protein